MQQTLEKQKGSFVETKGFFCFSLSKRTAKKAASKLNVFCMRYFSKTKRKPAKKKKKIQRNVFLSICRSHDENRQIRAKIKSSQKFNIDWLCPRSFNYLELLQPSYDTV